MSIFEAVVLGLLQGITEFIPISSSGHLVLVPWLLNWSAPGLAFDTVVHLGTVVAVVAFFAGDILVLIRGWLRSIHQRNFNDEEGRLAWLLIIGTVPAALAGFLLEDWFSSLFSAPLMVGVFLLVTAGILLAAEKISKANRELKSLGIASALVIGIAQAFAICPGISRSGATIAAGLGVGLARPMAARFSFLLSIPIILGAAASQSRHVIQGGLASGEVILLVVGFVAAAISGYLCIRFLMQYLQHHGLQVFAAYCAIVGVVTIVLASITH